LSTSFAGDQSKEKEDNNSNNDNLIVVLTADEILRKGLNLVGLDRDRQRNMCRATNLQRFKSQYGSMPVVYAQIWEDLQTTAIPEARIDNKKTDVEDGATVGLVCRSKGPGAQGRKGNFTTDHISSDREDY
jgi:hypothetical protein